MLKYKYLAGKIIKKLEWDLRPAWKVPQKRMILNFEILHLSKETRSESMEVLSGLGYQIIDHSFDRAALHQDLIQQ
jgi:hypothetical protein